MHTRQNYDINSKTMHILPTHRAVTFHHLNFTRFVYLGEKSFPLGYQQLLYTSHSSRVGSVSQVPFLHNREIRTATPMNLRVLLLVHGLGSLFVLCKIGLLVGDLLPERGELLSLLLLDVEALLGGLLLVEGIAGRGTARAGSAGVTGSHALSDGRERAGGPRGSGARDGAGGDAERHCC